MPRFKTKDVTPVTKIWVISRININSAVGIC